MKFTGFTFFKVEDPASVTEEHRLGAFDKGAKTYDEEVCSGEWLMGITKLRSVLSAYALAVCCPVPALPMVGDGRR